MDSNKRASSFVINRNDLITLFLFFFVIIRSLIRFLIFFFFRVEEEARIRTFIYSFILFFYHASIIDRIITHSL